MALWNAVCGDPFVISEDAVCGGFRGTEIAEIQRDEDWVLVGRRSKALDQWSPLAVRERKNILGKLKTSELSSSRKLARQYHLGYYAKAKKNELVDRVVDSALENYRKLSDRELQNYTMDILGIGPGTRTELLEALGDFGVEHEIVEQKKRYLTVVFQGEVERNITETIVKHMNERTPFVSIIRSSQWYVEDGDNGTANLSSLSFAVVMALETSDGSTFLPGLCPILNLAFRFSFCFSRNLWDVIATILMPIPSQHLGLLVFIHFPPLLSGPCLRHLPV